MSDTRNGPIRSPRAIVLCFDGTNGQYDSTNTNVVKFFGLLSKNCPDKQVSYYQAGVGTYFAPGIVSPLWARLASLVDEACAWYLDAHVMDGYKYLMENYLVGDKICLFGFSRGAYTARALAGMLTKVGLLPKDNDQQVEFAYKAYKRSDKEGIKLAAGFKETFSQDVQVEFVGVWDTVQSTGVLINRILPFTDSNTAIKTFRHALSLDEHRARFRPNLYHWPTKDGEYGGEVALDESHPGFAADAPPSCTDVLEVWFAGCHSDIGGGNVEDDVKVSLAQITLHWMVEQVIKSKCGIVFDANELANIGFTPAPLLPQLDSNTDDLPSKHNQPTQQSPVTYPEQSDAIAPLFDELKRNILWWILEVTPSSYAWQDRNGIWNTQWSVNFGKGRYIPFRKPMFHHTVKERMDYKPLKYKPLATFDHNEVYV